MPVLPHAAIVDAAAPHDDAVAAHDGRSSPPTVGARFVLHSRLHCSHLGRSHLVGPLSLTPLPPRQRQSRGVFRSHASPRSLRLLATYVGPIWQGDSHVGRPLFAPPVPAAATTNGGLGRRA